MYGEIGNRLAPVTDLLEHLPLPELAEALRAQTATITRQWAEAVRQTLPSADSLNFAQLLDGLPRTLAHLADSMERGGVDRPESNEHGVTRFNQDYSIVELMMEHRLLRRLVVERVEEQLSRRLTPAEEAALDDGIDTMLQQSVVAYVEYQKANLRSATEAESKFLSYMSHDLRNSLNSVVLSLEVLARNLARVPQFSNDLADVEAAKQSILDTIDGMERLLQAERLRKKPQPKIRRVELAEVAAEAIRHVAYQARKKGVALVVQVGPQAVVHSDREWIARVLQNLVGNAVKYSTKGTVRVTAAPREGDGWVLAVSDEGPGIAPEQLKTLFQAFQRGETHGQPGVGLGLAIASQAARMLGGELTVESQLGAGSTFRLALPEAISARVG